MRLKSGMFGLFMVVLTVPCLLVVGRISAKEPRKLDRVKGFATKGVEASCAVPTLPRRPGVPSMPGYRPGDEEGRAISERASALSSRQVVQASEFYDLQVRIHGEISQVLGLLGGRLCREVLDAYTEGRNSQYEAFDDRLCDAMAEVAGRRTCGN